MANQNQPNLRSCRFAGSFFPADKDKLNAALDHFLAEAEKYIAPSRPAPLAIVSPHAGYRFSGRIAGLSFQSAKAGGYRHVVVLSPSHRHRFDGMAFPSHAGFATPLGPCLIDQKARDLCVSAGLATVLDAAHDQEHGIETQLPFVQRLFPTATITPVVVGNATAERVEELLRLLLNNTQSRELLIVVSSDLSHFLNDKAAQIRDGETAQNIEIMQAAKVGPESACGWLPLQGFLRLARNMGLRGIRLGMMNSGLVNADLSRVVGYGAWSFGASEGARLQDTIRNGALRLARLSLEAYAKNGKRPAVKLGSFHHVLQGHLASFITLKQSGRLRGCIGSLVAHRPLAQDICHNAVSAGHEDQRFAPLTPNELAGIQIKIAILSAPQPMPVLDEADALNKIRPGIDGLILEAPGHRGLFLPMVWEGLQTPEKFLQGLKVKAGLTPEFWSDEITLHRFTTESFAEPGK